ncbi:hypothetical protein P7C73_g5335, partial [Tremellales sp. Uapishka_1]
MDAAGYASAFAYKYLITGRSPTGGPPIITLASRTADGLFRIPDDMFVLVQSYNAGFIVLSYIIAFIGSLCTLELLLRRTSNRGVGNIVLLATAGCCFGAVSTFAMHFVGNNSLSLHHPNQKALGYSSLYLSYDAGFTILSLVVTCLAMTLAFFVMGTQVKDWSCAPHGRKHKQRVRARKESKFGGDEYKKWKSIHRKASPVSVGSLLVKAGMVANWSMLDHGTGRSGEKNQKGWKGSFKSDKNGKNGMAELDEDPSRVGEEDEEERILRDKTLAELDFRKGRQAVRDELEKRDGMATRSSHRLSHGTVSMPSPAYSGDIRRLSTPAEFFTPGYDEPAAEATKAFAFPAEGDHSTLHLLPQVARPSAIEYTLAPPLALHLPQPEPIGRRASLPSAYTFPPTPQSLAQTPTYQSGLARIQSLPEDVESQNTSGSHSISSSRRDSPPEPVKKANRFARRDFTKLETFLGFDVVTASDIFKVFVTGFTAGLGVAAMHYIGQLSITGLPYIAYKVSYVVASVIIACGAVMVALYIMFVMLRPKLKQSWYLKIGVAVILATAVCAMHYTGMRGTIYAWPEGIRPSSTSSMSGTKKAILALVAALAFVACAGVAVFFYLDSARIRRERRRRRRVVVAAVLVDEDDRILVNSIDGLLPMCDIASLTTADLPETSKKSSMGSVSSGTTLLGMDLTTGHEAFIQALMRSWHWKSPSNANISNSSVNTVSQPGAIDGEERRGSAITNDSSNYTSTGNRPVPLSISRFLEKFQHAANQLAMILTGQSDGVSRLGVLYDQILTTGWVRLGNSTDTVSKGQLMFLVRRVRSSAEISDLLSRQFLFADASAVAGTLHKMMSVPYDHTHALLTDVRVFSDFTQYSSLQSGVLYTGVAVVQATPFDGLRILLESSNRALLPMRELCRFGEGARTDGGMISGTVEEIGEALTWLDGMTLLSIITRNMGGNSLGGERVNRLLKSLERAIIPMLDALLTAEDMEHVIPRLTLHPQLVPLTPGGSRSNPTGFIPPYLVVFYANYDAAVNTFTDKWLPFNLFRAQNACMMAPKIQQAIKLDHLSAVLADKEGVYANKEFDVGYNYNRRPSKVQFSDAPSVPQPSIESAPPPPVQFSKFAFPAKAGNNDDDDGKDEPPSQSQPQAAAQTLQSVLRPPRLVSRNSDLGPTEGFAFGQAGTGTPGVGMWDPEWLLNLLRSKLRADA